MRRAGAGSGRRFDDHVVIEYDVDDATGRHLHRNPAGHHRTDVHHSRGDPPRNQHARPYHSGAEQPWFDFRPTASYHSPYFLERPHFHG